MDYKEWNDYVLKDQSHPSVYWISKSVDLRKYHPSQLHLDLVPLHLYHLLYQSMHYVVMYPSCEAMIALHYRHHLVSLLLSVRGKSVSLNDFRYIMTENDGEIFVRIVTLCITVVKIFNRLSSFACCTRSSIVRPSEGWIVLGVLLLLTADMLISLLSERNRLNLRFLPQKIIMKIKVATTR